VKRGASRVEERRVEKSREREREREEREEKVRCVASCVYAWERERVVCVSERASEDS